MTVRLSLVVVLAVTTVLLVRRAGLKNSHALVCVLLGFYVAGTSFAPAINHAVAVVVDELGRIHL